jgi:hypothetical protein
LQGTVVLLAVALAGTLVTTVATVYPTDILLAIQEGSLISISLAVLTAYVPGIVRDMQRHIDGVFVLRLGVCAAWSATGIWSSLRLVELLRGGEILIVTIRGYLVELLVVAGILHIMALGMIEGRPVWRNVWACLVAGSWVGRVHGLADVTASRFGTYTAAARDVMTLSPSRNGDDGGADYRRSSNNKRSCREDG